MSSFSAKSIIFIAISRKIRKLVLSLNVEPSYDLTKKSMSGNLKFSIKAL